MLCYTHLFILAYSFLTETCKCPSNIFVNWHEKSPYLLKSPSGKISGIFKEIADKMIRKSCGTCNGISPSVNYYISPSGESPEKSSEDKCIAKLGLGYHITFPVFGRAEIRNFMDHHIFVLLVQSGGSAMIVSGAIDYAAKTLNALKSVKSTWPMVLISVLMCIVFGILLWSVVSIRLNFSFISRPSPCQLGLIIMIFIILSNDLWFIVRNDAKVR